MLDTVLRARLSPKEERDYDAFVAAASDGGFAQLRDYADLATSDRPFRAEYFLARERGRSGGAVVGAALVLRSRLGVAPLPFAQVERGPVVGVPSRLGEVLVALRRALLLRGVVRLSVMPYWSGAERAHVEATLARLGFRAVDDDAGAHVRSVRMPLVGTEAEVLGGSGRKTLRYELKQAAKAGVVSARARGEEARAFVALSRETMGAQGRAEAAKGDAFGLALARVTARSERVACFVSRDGASGRALGAVVVARTNRRLTLLLGATSTERRPFSKMSPPLLEAIRWARGHGALELDLGGVPREGDTDAKRAAIAAFKHGFTKDTIDLVREHVRWG